MKAGPCGRHLSFMLLESYDCIVTVLYLTYLIFEALTALQYELEQCCLAPENPSQATCLNTAKVSSITSGWAG